MERKPLPASLQETNPHRAWAGTCRRGEEQSCWTRTREHNSRRSSPGSGASTPLRDAWDWSPPGRTPSVQLNHATGGLPPAPSLAAVLAPISPRLRRTVWPPNPAKLAPSFAATDTLTPESTVTVPAVPSNTATLRVPVAQATSCCRVLSHQTLSPPLAHVPWPVQVGTTAFGWVPIQDRQQLPLLQRLQMQRAAGLSD